MLENVSNKTWIRSATVAGFFFTVFLILFLISIFNNATDSTGEKTVTKSEAITIASAFIEQQTKHTVTETEALYRADQHYTAYINHEDKTIEHFKTINHIYPYEFYTVYTLIDDLEMEAKVDVSVVNGTITGWSIPLEKNASASEASEAFLLNTLEAQGFPTTNIALTKQEDGVYIAKNEAALNITDAVVSVALTVKSVAGEPFVTSYQSSVNLPDAYLSDIKKQDKLAKNITYWGFIGLTVVLAVLAIIYSILYRRHTSFKYGLVFTIIAAIISFIFNIAMTKHVLISESDTLYIPSFSVAFMLIFTLVFILVSAASHYISFVAGDGLWKAQGFNLWPRFKEKGFGATVWNSMLLAYLFALAGLGIQNLIFEGLSLVIGTHQGIDATQSPLNSTMIWFFPMLAWTAAITEEAVYRYFGVGIFRRWFKNTYVAALIPSLIWACGHVLYPFYPVTTRIIELVIIGLLFTFIMVKFGLLTAIFTHAIFNTIAMSLSILSAREPYIFAAVALYLIMPIVIAFSIKLIHKQYMKKRPEPPAPPILYEQ